MLYFKINIWNYVNNYLKGPYYLMLRWSSPCWATLSPSMFQQCHRPIPQWSMSFITTMAKIKKKGRQKYKVGILDSSKRAACCLVYFPQLWITFLPFSPLSFQNIPVKEILSFLRSSTEPNWLYFRACVVDDEEQMSSQIWDSRHRNEASNINLTLLFFFLAINPARPKISLAL